MSYFSNDLPVITICLAVLNEIRNIELTLRDLMDQDYPAENYEVIIAEGGSSDGTETIVRKFAAKYPQFIVVQNEKGYAAAGRNLGLRSGKGDVFVFLDGHCHIPSPNWLSDIADLLRSTGADCLARPQPLSFPHNSHFQTAVAFCRGSQIGHASNSLIYSSHEGFVSPVSHGAVYRRGVIESIGFLDESFDACEDVEFNYRVQAAGFRTFMSYRLAVIYKPRKTIRSLFRQVFRYGRGRAKLLAKHPGAFTIDMALALVPALSVLVMIVLSIVSASLLLAFGALIVAYGIFTAGFGLFSGNRMPWRSVIYLPFIYSTIHFGFSVGLIVGACSESYSLSHITRALAALRLRGQVPKGESG